MKIEKAIESDHLILTEITKKSKAFWGYSDEQLKIWENNLTISYQYIFKNATFKLVENGVIIGYYSFVKNDNNTIYLDNLFILPENINQGLGKLLVKDFLKRVENKGFEKIYLHSDPNAEKFYSKLGFLKVGEFETSIKNRYLPIMEMRNF